MHISFALHDRPDLWVVVFIVLIEFFLSPLFLARVGWFWFSSLSPDVHIAVLNNQLYFWVDGKISWHASNITLDAAELDTYPENVSLQWRLPICCKYVAENLCSFLLRKTKFRVEILRIRVNCTIISYTLPLFGIYFLQKSICVHWLEASICVCIGLIQFH